MRTRKTSATPAGIPRSRSSLTRAQRREARQAWIDVEATSDAYDELYGEDETCPSCDGTGWEVTCCDDICVSLGECMHGDGEEVCFECGGEGVVPSRQFLLPMAKVAADADQEATQ